MFFEWSFDHDKYFKTIQIQRYNDLILAFPL